MKKFMNWLENSFSPALNKVNHNVWILTLKDSVNQTMPLIFIGSVFAMLTLPGDIFKLEWWPNFWTPQGWTMGLIALIMSFLLPFNLMEKVRLRRSRFIAGISGIILYAITISPQLKADGAVGFGHSAFGPGGMIVAIVTGILVGIIMRAFGRFSFFKEDSAIPDFVRAWFDQMLPLALVTVIGWVGVELMGFDLYNAILRVFFPLQGVVETFWGFMLIRTLEVALYSMGISAWVLVPITSSIALAAIEANMTAGAANIFTNSFSYAYLCIGGMGCTLALAIMMCFSKSKRLNALGKASIVPSFFNINEPVVFGAIAWNPIMMIGMILNAIVVSGLAYLFTRVIAFGVIPKILFQIWYCPYPICTWLATGGSVASVLLVIFLFLVTAALWYPFFKIYEKQCIQEEMAEEKNSSSAA